MGEPGSTGQQPPRAAGPAELGWVRWGITFAGLGLAAGCYDMAVDNQAGLWTRIQMGLIGLGGLGFAVSMWVPPFARAFWWVLHKLR